MDKIPEAVILLPCNLFCMPHLISSIVRYAEHVHGHDLLNAPEAAVLEFADYVYLGFAFGIKQISCRHATSKDIPDPV